MRVLLTGATGFVGTRLGIELCRKGIEVIALVRSPSADLPFPAELCLWKDAGKLKDIDAVIHLAGESIGTKPWTAERKKEILASRTETSEQVAALVRAVSGRKPQVVLAASAIGFYGDRGDDFLAEGEPVGKGFLAETCQEWEKSLAKISADRMAIFRIGIVLGKEGGALKEMLPLFKRGVGSVLGNGKQWMSWIHLEDLVQLFLFALENERVKGVFNAVAPHPVTNKEFSKGLAKAIHARLLPAVPSFVLRLVMGEMADLVLLSQRVQEKFSGLGFSFKFPKLPEALAAIFEVESRRGIRCHEFSSEVWLPAPVDKVFDFLSRSKNLEKIIPPEFQLKIVSDSCVKYKEGHAFDYSMVCHGIKMNCRSHVLDFVENKSFSTTQQKGPTTFWYHTHKFERLGSGTLVTEKVIYRIRCGYLGELIGHGRILGNLAEIFKFRRSKMREIFKIS